MIVIKLKEWMLENAKDIKNITIEFENNATVQVDKKPGETRYSDDSVRPGFDKHINEIIKIIDETTFEIVLNYYPSLEPIKALIKEGDSNILIENLIHKQKELMEEKKSISYRIDEITSYLKSEVSFDSLEFRKRGITAGIKNAEEKLMNGLRISVEFHKEKEQLYEIKYKIRDIEFKAQQGIQQSVNLLNALFKNSNPTIDLLGSLEYRQLKLRVEELEDKNKFKKPDNKIISELESKKEELQLELEEVDNSLCLKAQFIKIKARLRGLLEREKDLKVQILELEKQELLYELYIKTRNKIIEAKINSKFNFLCTQASGELKEFYVIFIERKEGILEK